MVCLTQSRKRGRETESPEELLAQKEREARLAAQRARHAPKPGDGDGSGGGGGGEAGGPAGQHGGVFRHEWGVESRCDVDVGQGGRKVRENMSPLQLFERSLSKKDPQFLEGRLVSLRGAERPGQGVGARVGRAQAARGGDDAALLGCVGV